MRFGLIAVFGMLAVSTLLLGCLTQGEQPGSQLPPAEPGPAVDSDLQLPEDLNTSDAGVPELEDIPLNESLVS